MTMQKIAVAVDFSPESEVAVAQAMRLARQKGAELTLLHVGHVLAPLASTYAAGHRAYRDLIASHMAQDNQRLTELRERLVGQGVEVSKAFEEGYPPDSICELAEQAGADLIVLGTHGRTGVRRFLLGSVAEMVARLSDIPVLIARGQRQAGGYKRVLVPTDFASTLPNVIAWAGEVAANGAEVEVMHAWHHMSLAYTPFPTGTETLFDESVYQENLRATEKETEAQAKDALAPLVRAGFETKYQMVLGAPGSAILDHAPGHDLIVMHSVGRRGIRRAVMGSVAETVVRHAPCSVLVVRDKNSGTEGEKTK